jgi:hypothetical protein
MLEMVESIWCAGVVPTIDRATSAWRSSRRVRQHSIRCTTAHHCCLAGRAQMSHNVDSSKRVVQCRPSTSLPVHDGAAVVCAKVAYDVPVLAVVEWRTARRCRTMSTRRGARCTIDHRPRCPCTVAPPSCAPRLPMMYQCSLWWNGGPHADVGQCRLVLARSAVSIISLAASVRRCRGTIEMHDCTYGCIKRNDLVITTMSISERRRFAAAKRASDAARACAQNNRTSHFQAPLSMHWHVRLGTNATS